jgi:hypothetical protein
MQSSEEAVFAGCEVTEEVEDVGEHCEMGEEEEEEEAVSTEGTLTSARGSCWVDILEMLAMGTSAMG